MLKGLPAHFFGIEDADSGERWGQRFVDAGWRCAVHLESSKIDTSATRRQQRSPLSCALRGEIEVGGPPGTRRTEGLQTAAR